MKSPAFIRGFAAPVAGGKFDWPLPLGEMAIILCLWLACGAFTGAEFLPWPGVIWLALGATGCSWRLGLYRRPPLQPGTAIFVRSLLLAPALALLLFVGVALRGPQVSLAFALWFGSVAAVLGLGFRLSFGAVRSLWPGQPLEIFRWLAVAGAGVALMLPYYGRLGIGSGDAYWYVVMLADFTTQLRHGVFPIWVGQSEYAFNGAVSPLRLAPWFQYSGGLLDIFTAHRLEPLALKNALLCLSGLATAGSAYLSLRAVLPRRPGLACVLALLWLASPSTLPALGAGSLYMQFMALPFLPPLLLGCWRVWTRDDTAGRLLIVVALAGMMLSHTPTALWGGLVAGGIYLGQLVWRRNWSAEGRRLAAMAGLFFALGCLPIGSALTIDNPVVLQTDPALVPLEIARAFPADLGPVRSEIDIQVGATLLVGGVVSLLLLGWLRPRGGAALAAVLVAIVVLTFPVPWLTAAIWMHLPRLLVSINNTSAPARLFEFLALVIVFALAAAAGDDRISRRAWRAFLLLALLAGGGIWSAKQAAQMLQIAGASATEAGWANAYLRPENLALPRFAYASFAAVPAYASHAHMEPLLENRLLDRATLTVMTANADAAAPRLRPDSAPETLPRLVQSGVWTATSLEHSRAYRLAPQIRLEAGRRYALRVDFFHPEIIGQLQFRNADLFRDYLLPDSGEGMGLRPSPMAFGALPTSSGVAALQQWSRDSTEPQQLLVLMKYSAEQFEFARFWLYSYSADDLPIRVLSWVPYRAATETAVPAFLETPRIWQRGWRANVNGRSVAVQRSPQNLAMIPIEPGASDIRLTFHPTLWLSAWFWLCLASWAILLGWGFTRVARQALAPAAPGVPPTPA